MLISYVCHISLRQCLNKMAGLLSISHSKRLSCLLICTTVLLILMEHDPRHQSPRLTVQTDLKPPLINRNYYYRIDLPHQYSISIFLTCCARPAHPLVTSVRSQLHTLHKAYLFVMVMIHSKVNVPLVSTTLYWLRSLFSLADFLLYVVISFVFGYN